MLRVFAARGSAGRASVQGGIGGGDGIDVVGGFAELVRPSISQHRWEEVALLRWVVIDSMSLGSLKLMMGIRYLASPQNLSGR